MKGRGRPKAIGLPAPTGTEIPLGQPGQLRYEFTVGQGLAKATLFATAHGVYQAEINGTEVDDHVLKPGWTAYADRLNHETTDVTALLQAGANAIGVWLAGGWYAEKYGFHGFAKPFYGEQPAVKVELRLEYADGTRQTVASGPGLAGHHGGPTRFQRHLRGGSLRCAAHGGRLVIAGLRRFALASRFRGLRRHGRKQLPPWRLRSVGSKNCLSGKS